MRPLAKPAEAAAPAQIFCDEIGQRATQQDCDYFHQLAQRLQSGAAAFNAPDPMTVGQSTTLQLAVGAAGAPVAKTVGQLPGSATQYDLPVGRFMTAELYGEGFDIDPKGPQSKEVSAQSVTTWEWKLTAREEGLRTLVLKTSVDAIGGDGKRVVLRSSTKDQGVHVKVGTWDHLWAVLTRLPDWLKAITAVVTALGALATAVLAFRAVFKKP